VKDGVQALRVRQRVDIGTGGGGHMRRKQAAAEDRNSEEQERDVSGTKHVYLFGNGSELQPYGAFTGVMSRRRRRRRPIVPARGGLALHTHTHAAKATVKHFKNCSNHSVARSEIMCEI
jgi:UDP-N-acetylglucosamine:LPS N-acetylglucosamine transferase